MAWKSLARTVVVVMVLLSSVGEGGGTSLYSSLWGYWLAVAGDNAPGVAPRARLRLTMHSSHEIVGCPRFCPPRSRAGAVSLSALSHVCSWDVPFRLVTVIPVAPEVLGSTGTLTCWVGS